MICGYDRKHNWTSKGLSCLVLFPVFCFNDVESMCFAVYVYCSFFVFQLGVNFLKASIFFEIFACTCLNVFSVIQLKPKCVFPSLSIVAIWCCIWTSGNKIPFSIFITHGLFWLAIDLRCITFCFLIVFCDLSWFKVWMLVD